MYQIHRQSQRAPIFIWIAGAVAALAFGAIDYLTGPELSFSIFYLLPITLVCWFAGRRYGMWAALVSSAIWLAADLAADTTFSNPLVPVWNASVRLGFFIIVVQLESIIKERTQDLEVRVAARTLHLQAEIAERINAEELLQRYAQRLEILHEIDRAILAAVSVESIAQEVSRRLRPLIPYDRVNITLVDFAAQRIQLLVDQSDGDDTSPLATRFALRALGNIDWMLEPLRRGEAYMVEDPASPALSAQLQNFLRAQGMQTMANVPLMVEGVLIGTINLLARTPGSFVPEHLEICSEIASQLGIAIRHAQLIEQLQSGREQLHALSQRLLEVQEIERRHIARELHDEIGQMLTALNIYLETIARIPVHEQANSLNQARGLISELMERVRRLSLDLRPVMLDDLGLLPALLWQLDRYTAQTHVTATLRHQGVEGRRFQPELETAAYRITQEALTNVARYAGTDQVSISVWVDQGVLGLQIEDQGAGFDPDAALEARTSSGLAGMRERASLLGGKLTIDSSPGSGTRLLAELPVTHLTPDRSETA